MWKVPKEIEQLEVFKKNAKTVGVILMVIGFLGAMFPVAASLTTVVFVAWMLLISAFIVGYFTYITDAGDWRGWLKTLIFFGVGVYMLVNPAGGIATLGLLFSIYFFMDAFSGFTLAASFYPNKGWGIWTFNAILSLLMAMIFVIGWPQTSVLLIGLLVGFSLFFDGLALLMGANLFDKMWKDEQQ
ncbi:hypothetical protein YH65_05505 [Sulfurovum lithotrophicum]|uniref:HdeD family acid-resistance protein n=1 Tax=Sulfurovum lithotrophicum TaxID=206403 RepID=A0A7U4RQP7_9BACT|nr:DUF308 domain-containing protein [Sulfurovum lithotrophicum]AKF24906.1 hypothetical protein YH65_05505 [Sulfurovum lithotrophicum]